MDTELLRTIAEYGLASIIVYTFLHFGVKILFKFIDNKHGQDMPSVKNIEDGIVQLQTSVLELIKFHESLDLVSAMNTVKNIKNDITKMDTKIDVLKERGVEDKVILQAILKAIEHQTDVMDKHYKKQNGGA